MLFVALITSTVFLSSCDDDDDDYVYDSASNINSTWKKSGHWECEIKVSVSGLADNKVYSLGVAYDDSESKLNVPSSCNQSSKRDGVTSSTVYITVGPSATVYYKPFVKTTDGKTYYSQSCYRLTGAPKP